MAPEAHQWNGGVRVQSHIGGRRDQTANDIHEQVPDVAEGLLDVVAEDPQKPHVEQDVAHAAVQEHRGEQRQEHVLAGEDRILGSVETDVGHDLFAPEREPVVTSQAMAARS